MSGGDGRANHWRHAELVLTVAMGRVILWKVGGRVSYTPLLPWPLWVDLPMNTWGEISHYQSRKLGRHWPSDVLRFGDGSFSPWPTKKNPVSQRWTWAAWLFPVVPSIHAAWRRFHLPWLSFNQFVPAAHFPLQLTPKTKQNISSSSLSSSLLSDSVYKSA